MADNQHVPEDEPAKVPATLAERVEAADRAVERAVAKLRQQLSDDEVLDEFGIDLSRLTP